MKKGIISCLIGIAIILGDMWLFKAQYETGFHYAVAVFCSGLMLLFIKIEKDKT